MDSNQQQMNYMRGVNGQSSFHPGAPFIGGSGDLTNLSTDLQQSSYEFDKQVRRIMFSGSFSKSETFFFCDFSHGQQSGPTKVSANDPYFRLFDLKKHAKDRLKLVIRIEYDFVCQSQSSFRRK